MLSCLSKNPSLFKQKHPKQVEQPIRISDVPEKFNKEYAEIKKSWRELIDVGWHMVEDEVVRRPHLQIKKMLSLKELKKLKGNFRQVDKTQAALNQKPGLSYSEFFTEYPKIRPFVDLKTWEEKSPYALFQETSEICRMSELLCILLKSMLEESSLENIDKFFFTYGAKLDRLLDLFSVESARAVRRHESVDTCEYKLYEENEYTDVALRAKEVIIFMDCISFQCSTQHRHDLKMLKETAEELERAAEDDAAMPLRYIRCYLRLLDSPLDKCSEKVDRMSHLDLFKGGKRSWTAKWTKTMSGGLRMSAQS